MATEETLVLVKPDGVARGLSGAILARIEAKGYSLVDLRLVEPDRERLERHYAEHEGKPFYEPLVEFMLSGPVVAMVVEGERCIEGFRALAGATDPTVALPGTIAHETGSIGTSARVISSVRWSRAFASPASPGAMASATVSGSRSTDAATHSMDQAPPNIWPS